ncbi:hypothetical protein DL96DRAFT_1705386 [Flagelloscypha sp. PMI_526]|nr:hypothetical protein DL96DRAFT_1705386 [Flagelloscypha sp. PMI_526]
MDEVYTKQPSDVEHKINDIRYFSVILRKESDIAAFETWIQSQPSETVSQNVRALLILNISSKLHSRVEALISACSGIEHFGIWIWAESSELRSLAIRCLTSLPRVRTLTFNSTLTRIFGQFLKSKAPPHVAFRDTLVQVDWGCVPSFVPDVFPNVSYAIMQPDWPLHDDDIHDMEAWICRSSFNGLVLPMDMDSGFADYLEPSANPPEDYPILKSEKVVVVPSLANWVDEWEKQFFERKDDPSLFAICKKRTGQRGMDDTKHL